MLTLIRDSGIYLSIYLKTVLLDRSHSLRKFLPISSPSQQILELGAGCGTVGLTLAKLFPKANVVLTDFLSAREICTRNIFLNKSESKSTVSFNVFDWEFRDPSDPEEQANDIIFNTIWNLVVVCDCTYNPDSYDSLGEVLAKVTSFNESTRILLVHKERHGSERVVFDKLRAYGLHILWQEAIAPIDEANVVLTILTRQNERVIEAKYTK